MIKQKDNSDLAAKIRLRKYALSLIDKPVILDLFAGEGVLHDLCYEGYDYTAVDKKDIKRRSWIKSDNRRALPILLHQKPYNFFDCDAYGNPWIVASDMIKYISEGDFILVLTCGMKMNLQGFKNLSNWVRKVIGYGKLKKSMLLGRWYDDVIRMIISTWLHVKILEAKRIQNQFSHQVYYYMFHLRKEVKCQ